MGDPVRPLQSKVETREPNSTFPIPAQPTAPWPCISEDTDRSHFPFLLSLSVQWMFLQRGCLLPCCLWTCSAACGVNSPVEISCNLSLVTSLWRGKGGQGQQPTSVQLFAQYVMGGGSHWSQLTDVQQRLAGFGGWVQGAQPGSSLGPAWVQPVGMKPLLKCGSVSVVGGTKSAVVKCSNP